MKYPIRKAIIIVLGLGLFAACDNENIDSEITSADVASIKSTVASGQWRVSYYLDSDQDETSDYAGYIFTFSNDGVLSVTDGGTSLSGAWSVVNSDNSDDDSKEDNDIDFNILFNGSNLFEELSDDWDIVQYSDTKIELFDVSGGDGTTDYLTFEKL